MILALESVFDQCSVACVTVDGTLVAEQTLTGKRLQTQQILPMIEALMTQQALAFSQLTAVAFNRGPGAFSGIRITTAVAQALAFAHDLPCLPVSSLQAVAQAAWQTHQLTEVIALTDARMNQVYVGNFMLKNGIMHPSCADTERLLDYGSPINDKVTLVGNGAGLVTAAAGQKTVIDIVPTATIIGQIGAYQYHQQQAVSAAHALPVYLRNNAWKTLAEQQR